MSEAAVEFEHVSHRYPGGTLALRDVTLRVEAGELLAIVGPNGAGKSTLLKLMMGLLPVQEGRVRVHGMTPQEARRAGLIGYVAQRSAAELAFPVSARQVVAMGATRGLGAWRLAGRRERERVDRALELVGASTYADRPIGQLSGGQVQRVLIARALAPEPKILALDEPTVGIDAVGQQRFSDLVARLHTELKLTILLVSHDLRAIAGGVADRRVACDRIACLRTALHFHAAPHGVTPNVLAHVFEHDLADVFGDLHVNAHAAADCPGDHAHGPGDGSGRAHD